ncbi:MAG: DUF128 domain-containing protein [Dehalococcoidia bacterium]
MIGQENREVERKVIAILRVLSDSPEPLGGRIIARRLGDFGIELGERAVRYHLKLMDERGLTRSVGRRDGRSITQRGVEELKSALVNDRVGSIAARIELLSYQTSLDLEKGAGEVPIDTCLFPKEEFIPALDAMKDAFSAGLCVSDLVAVAFEGERLGEVIVPRGKAGLATVSSIVVNGVLLKAGIPLDSKFGGILQIRNHKPLRFIELIEYSGCSLDPAEIFVASKMTSVGEAAARGEGKILANLGETPAPCRPMVETIIEKLKEAGLGVPVMIGETSEPVCEVPVRLNKIGMILQSGLNPAAAAVEAGIVVVNRALSGVMDFGELRSFWDL